MLMKLHNYWRSSTSYRVRIVLAMKGLDHEYLSYSLPGGEQRGDAYTSLNRHRLVPSLELNDGAVLTQSLAIIEYLEEVHPVPPVLPETPLGRARVRAMAHAVALEIHPVNNLRMLKYLQNELGHSQDEIDIWFRHWVAETFRPLEADLANHPATGRFCHGEIPTLADICLIPQVFNGTRFDVDMTPYPTIQRIYDTCMEMPVFADAAPPHQPDAE